jgi:hypothetical protein
MEQLTQNQGKWLTLQHPRDTAQDRTRFWANALHSILEGEEVEYTVNETLKDAGKVLVASGLILVALEKIKKAVRRVKLWFSEGDVIDQFYLTTSGHLISLGKKKLKLTREDLQGRLFGMIGKDDDDNIIITFIDVYNLDQGLIAELTARILLRYGKSLDKLSGIILLPAKQRITRVELFGE